MASRGLGTLSISLVAEVAGFVQGMDKAERQSKKFRKEIQNNLKQTSQQLQRGLQVSAAAAAAAIGALTAATIQQTRAGLASVDTQTKLARSLNTTYDSVTALQIAFEEGGVDGFERSLNRLNRRLGAAEAGTGAAAKTVEELGLNLAELSGLEADERIARIADAIVDSGVSAQRAARFVQDLGFEQKEAAQLFLQGGDAIRAYRQQVDDFGLSLSAIDTAMIEKANDDFARTGRLTDAISQQLAVQFAPILSAVSNQFVEAAKEAGGLEIAVGNAFNGVIDAAGFVLDAIEGIKRTFEVVGSGFAVVALGIKEVLLTMARDVVEIPTKAVNELIAALNKLPKVNIDQIGMSDLGQALQSEIELTQGAIEAGLNDIHNKLMEPLPSAGLKKFVADAQETAREIAEQMAAIDGAVAGGGGEGDGGEIDEALAKRRDAIRQSFETEKQTVLRIFGEQQEEIKALREAGAISQMETDNLKMQSEQAMFEKLQEMRERDLQRQQDYENARKALILGGAEQLFGSMAELTEQFAGKQHALYKIMFAAEKYAAIAQSIVAIQQGIALAAANPWPVNLGAMASVAAATAGIVGNIQSVALTGMAHDGIDSVPKTGTWLREKGERVMTSETSKKLDKKLDGGSGVVVNLYEDASKAGQVQQGQRDDGTTEVNVFVSDIMSNGPRAKAMQRAYGLRRQGT